MRIPIVILAGALLAGCTQPQQQSSIAALESGLTAADILALQYANKPVCDATNRPVCADPAIKVQMQKYAGDAYTAIKAAETSAAAGNAVDITAAASAFAAYQAVVATAVAAQKGK